MKVDRYVEPVEFDRWKQTAEDMGFLYVASGPLVRSSYKVGVDRSHARFSLIFFPPGG
jgi:lipoyl synthase